MPILGSFVMALLGGAAGAFAGAYLGEMWKGRTDDERIAAGQGAFVGKIWGTLGKLACGAVIVAIVAVDALLLKCGKSIVTGRNMPGETSLRGKGRQDEIAAAVWYRSTARLACDQLFVARWMPCAVGG